jgi:hypothetical protein
MVKTIQSDLKHTGYSLKPLIQIHDYFTVNLWQREKEVLKPWGAQPRVPLRAGLKLHKLEALAATSLRMIM